MMALPRTSSSSYGVVDKTIAPRRSGRIKFQGSYWKAELAYLDCRSVETGESVQVVGSQGITLLVIPVSYRLPFQS